MDFKRIEWIFLFVFTCIDIFLGINYFQNSHLAKTTTNVDQSKQVVKELRSDNISFNHLSNKKGTGYYLASQPNNALQQNVAKLRDQHDVFNTVNDHVLMTGYLNTPIDVRAEQRLTAVKALVQNPNMILFGHAYRYAANLSTRNQIVFVETFPEGPVYDERGQLTFKINHNGTISQYSQSYIGNVTTLREKMPTISAQEAVLALYTDNEIPDYSIIKWTKLAYTWLLDANGSVVYVPAWYVGIENKDTKNITIKRINAFTKALIKN